MGALRQWTLISHRIVVYMVIQLLLCHFYFWHNLALLLCNGKWLLLLKLLDSLVNPGCSQSGYNSNGHRVDNILGREVRHGIHSYHSQGCPRHSAYYRDNLIPKSGGCFADHPGQIAYHCNPCHTRYSKIHILLLSFCRLLRHLHKFVLKLCCHIIATQDMVCVIHPLNIFFAIYRAVTPVLIMIVGLYDTVPQKCLHTIVKCGIFPALLLLPFCHLPVT
nr:MAG TPA: hypothetical protein [Caudoviricetes sp.]